MPTARLPIVQAAVHSVEQVRGGGGPCMMRSQGLFTSSESEKEQAKRSKNKLQTSKKFFAFTSTFAQCEWVLN